MPLAVVQATLRPSVEDKERLEFAASMGDALWLALGAIIFGLSSTLAKQVTWQYIVGGVAIFLAVVAVQRAFWREHLTLNLVSRCYIYRRGYWPNIASEEGPLDEIKAVVLDVSVSSNTRGGEHKEWIASLVFKARKDLPVANFSLGGRGYQYLDRLAQRLRVAAVDRTSGVETSTDWTETGKPLVARSRSTMPRTFVPSLPDHSRIAVMGDAPERKIVLPSPGLKPSYFSYALFPLFPPWFTGTLYNLRVSGPFIAVAALFALVAAVSCVTNQEVQESADSLAFRTRFFGITLTKRIFAKRDIVDISIKPVPTNSLRRRDELQIRTASMVMDRTVARLSRDEMIWLAQALQAFATSA